eukprot:g11317.t1
MSGWLWMSLAPSYSEEVRNEEWHGECYARRAWTDFVDKVVAAGKVPTRKAAGTVDTYKLPLFHPQGCAPSSRSFPPGHTNELARLTGLPAPLRLLARLLAGGGGPAGGPAAPLSAERPPAFVRLRQGLWPGCQSDLARRWRLHAVISLLFGAAPESSALAAVAQSVLHDRRWQLVVGPELRYVLQVLDTIAEPGERSVLRVLQAVASAGATARSELRTQVLSRLSTARPAGWAWLMQLKGLGFDRRTTLTRVDEALSATLSGWVAGELLPNDYLLPCRLPAPAWSVATVLQTLAPPAQCGPRCPCSAYVGRGLSGLPGLRYRSKELEVDGGRLGAVLSEGTLRDAWLRDAPTQYPAPPRLGRLDQVFTTSFFNSALQFLAPLLWPLPAGQRQCAERACLACCLVRCARARLCREPNGPPNDFRQAFDALDLQFQGRGRSPDRPEMYELQTEEASVCVSNLLAAAVAERGGCSVRQWLAGLLRLRYGDPDWAGHHAAAMQGPLELLDEQPSPDEEAEPGQRSFFVLDEQDNVAAERQPDWLLLETQQFTLDVENTRPCVSVRLAGLAEPVEFWLESVCFRLEQAEHFVVVRRGLGGDGLHSGWHYLDGKTLISGSLWQALREVTKLGQQPARPSMFLLRRRQCRTHLTIVGDAVHYARYRRDHQQWGQQVRAALEADLAAFACLWPADRPLSKSSLIFVGAGRL